MPLDDSDNPLAIEIRQEMAEAYFGACRKMVDALEALKTFDRTLGMAVVDKEQTPGRSKLVDAAAERVHYVLIQREAMKLKHSETFFEDYSVPDEVVRQVGKTRRG